MKSAIKKATKSAIPAQKAKAMKAPVKRAYRSQGSK